MRYLFLVFSVLLTLSTKADFDFNANCQKAYQNILELKLSAGKQLIAAEKKIHPNNGIIPLLENYWDYFYLLSNESKSEFERLSSKKSSRLSTISDNDKNSPYYLYAQAEINLQWALIRSRYGEYFTASREINRANNLLRDNQKKFPNFHLNLKGLGLINVVIGALPDGFMKSTLATFGIKGDINTGLSQLDKLAENLPKSYYEPFYEEVVFYYVYLLSDVAKNNDAYSKTMKFTARFADSSLLKTYLQAYISARHGKSDKAISVLEKRPRGAAYQQFAYLDYLMGVVRLNKLDLGASSNFIQFLQNNKGDNYIKDTYLHLAWIALLKNDSIGYKNYIQKVKDSGSTYQYQDKQALNEIKNSSSNLVLLKARLLWDGGYYNRALSVLEEKKQQDFSLLKDQLEYNYRLARTYDELDNKEEALQKYQLTVNQGKTQKFYFAAKSALLMGNIYESKKDLQKAKAYYQIVLGMRGYEYENSINNEAKIALKRIGN